VYYAEPKHQGMGQWLELASIGLPVLGSVASALFGKKDPALKAAQIAAIQEKAKQEQTQRMTMYILVGCGLLAATGVAIYLGTKR
jgi:hypothetical protein